MHTAAVVRLGRQGCSLIEVLVSMLILIVGLLSSLYAIMKVMEYNYANGLRDEAVKIAQEEMECNRSLPIDSVTDATTNASCNDPNGSPGVVRQFRNGSVTFTVARIVAIDNVNSVRRVRIRVQWPFKSRTFTYTLESVLR